MKIAIVVVTYNALDYVKACIESVKKMTSSPYQLIVVDNASEAETQDYLKAESGIDLVQNDDNRLWSPANNQGMKAIDKDVDVVILMNSDVEVLVDNWTAVLEKVFNDNPKVGIAGPIWNHLPYKPIYGAVDGCFFAMRREVIEQIGYLTEEFPWNGAGFEYTLRAHKEGWESMQILNNKLIIHYGKRSRIENSKMLENQNINLTQMMTAFDISPSFSPGMRFRMLVSKWLYRIFQIEMNVSHPLSRSY